MEKLIDTFLKRAEHAQSSLPEVLGLAIEDLTPQNEDEINSLYKSAGSVAFGLSQITCGNGFSQSTPIRNTEILPFIETVLFLLDNDNVVFKEDKCTSPHIVEVCIKNGPSMTMFLDRPKSKTKPPTVDRILGKAKELFEKWAPEGESYLDDRLSADSGNIGNNADIGDNRKQVEGGGSNEADVDQLKALILNRARLLNSNLPDLLGSVLFQDSLADSTPAQNGTTDTKNINDTISTNSISEIEDVHSIAYAVNQLVGGRGLSEENPFVHIPLGSVCRLFFILTDIGQHITINVAGKIGHIESRDDDGAALRFYFNTPPNTGSSKENSLIAKMRSSYQNHGLIL